MDEQHLSQIIIDPGQFEGEPYIRDTRFTVREILEMLARGQSSDEILEDHPPLRPSHIQAAAAYAVYLLSRQPMPPDQPASLPDFS